MLRVAEEGYVSESLIETSTERSDDDDFFWLKFNGTRNGKLKVGFVLVAWI
jgi:hypothetical protein